MKKATFIKFLCLAVVALMLVPMVIACGETVEPGTSDSTPTSDSTGTSQSTGTSNSGKTFTVDFRPGNSQVVVEGNKTLTLAEGSKLTIAMAPKVTLEGHTFKGWSLTPVDPDFWDGAERTVNSDLVFYAVWEKNSGDTTGSSEPTGSTPTDDSKEDAEGGTDKVEKVTITFKLRGGVIIDGEESIQIDKGGRITLSIAPEVEREGYIFKGWSYDRAGLEEWFEDEEFDEDTDLYAQWEEKSQGGTTDSSTPSGGDTTDSSTPSGGDTTDSSTAPNPPSDEGDEVPNTITIEYEVGQGGDFENIEDYEKVVDYNTRFTTHPTPINSNPAMLFGGWYTDAECTIPVSNSTKYTQNTILYAYWIEQTECSDGSYNHSYSAWETSTEPDCVTPGISSRYCTECNDEQTKVGNPALGHKFGQWTEAFMAKQRTCQRLGCGETEYINFKNITTALLGNNPADQIDGNTENFYAVPFTNLINNKWDEGFGEYISPRGVGQAYIQFNFVEATAIDRVYFNGSGVTSINTYVLYEGDDEFTLVGIMGGVSEKEATPFAETDPTRKVVAVKFVEENPPQGTSYWREVAFVKIVNED